MRQISTLIFFIFLFSSFHLSAQYIWTNQSRSNGSPGGGMEGKDLAQDRWGNTFVFARFGGNLALDSLSFLEDGTVSDDGPLILVKYDPNGAVKWATPIKGKSSNTARTVAVDDMGNVYVAGQYTQTNSFTILEFGNGVRLQGNRSQSLFLAKADSSGLFQWAKFIQASDNPGEQFIDPRDMVVVGDNIFITGRMKEPVTAEGQVYNANNNGRNQLFLTKYKTDSTFQWFKHTDNAGQFSFTEGYFIKEAPNNSLYVTGIKKDSVDWQGSLVQDAGVQGVLLANFDFDGDLNWSTSISTSGSISDKAFSVDVDQNGNAYTLIQAEGTTTVGDSSFFPSVGEYVIGYAQDGRRRFVSGVNTGGFGLDLHSIVASPGGMTYIMGEYGLNSPVFNRDSLPVPGDFEEGYFISAMDKNGNVLGGRTLMDSTNNGGGIFTFIQVESAIYMNDGTISLIATLDGLAVAGDDTLSSTDGPDQTFIMKFNPEGLLNLSTSIDKVILPNLSIYPNPTTGILNIKGTDDERVERMILMNVAGKIVGEQEGKWQMDVSHLPEGYYFLQIETKTGRAVKKIVKY